MMETKRLRQADFITSILLILFGAWVLFEAFQMPMKGTYGGVKNAWYVSPALLPLIIGGSVFLLGIVLLMTAIRSGGASDCIQTIRSFKPATNVQLERFAAIVLAFVVLVYLFIPRVDFFLSIWFFLSYLILAFYSDSHKILRRLSLTYAVISIIFLIIFCCGLAEKLNSGFEYSTDVIALVSILLFHGYAIRMSIGSSELKKKYMLSAVISIIFPLVLAPVFRFALLVPLPNEGGIIDLMSLIYYLVR
ncbi:MAG: hypothetical protein R6V86_14730 [Spirochaetia bacterium]